MEVSQGSSLPKIHPKVFLHAVFVAFGLWFLMMILWPVLVLKPADVFSSTTEGHGMEWDNFSHLFSAKHTFTTDDATYELGAEKLTMENQKSKKVLLDRPEMIARFRDGFWYKIEAKAGVYNGKTQILQFISDVTMTDQRGTDLSTDSVVMRVKQGIFEGDSRVLGRLGDNVTIVAEGFRAEEGQKVEFLGNTEMLIALGKE